MTEQIIKKIGQIGVLNFPLEFLQWFANSYVLDVKSSDMRNAQVEQSEQLSLLIYRMSRRNNKGSKRLNPEYDCC